jgi:hypothetical protein
MMSQRSFRVAHGSSGTPVAAGPELGFQGSCREKERERERRVTGDPRVCLGGEVLL